MKKNKLIDEYIRQLESSLIVNVQYVAQRFIEGYPHEFDDSAKDYFLNEILMKSVALELFKKSMKEEPNDG